MCPDPLHDAGPATRAGRASPRDADPADGMSRRELFRLGAGVAAAAAGAAAMARTRPALAADDALRSLAGPGGASSKVLESGFRVYLDGNQMPNVRAVEFGEVETNLEILQSVASEVIYRDVVPRFTIRLRAAAGAAPDLEAWYDATKSGFGQPTREIRVELVPKKGGAAVRTIVAQGCVLESYTPGPLGRGGQDASEDVYGAACPVLHDSLSIVTL